MWFCKAVLVAAVLLSFPVDVGAVPASDDLASERDPFLPGETAAEIEAIRAILEQQRLRLEEQTEALNDQGQRLERQDAALEEQARLIAEQHAILEEQRRQIAALLGSGPISTAPVGGDILAQIRGRGPEDEKKQGEAGDGAPPVGSGPPGLSETPEREPGAGEPPRKRVGEAPPEPDAPPEIPALADLGGVLTPPGVLIVEPQLQFVQTNVNRFIFQGIEVAEAVLIGAIEATEADRDAFTSSVVLRTGITDRLEADIRVPFVHRDDEVTTLIVSEGADITRDNTGTGLGDIELGLHYQLNRGGEWPFFIGNLRVKSDTGEGPFDIDRDGAGIEEELATGSGFWSVQPSITFIKPSDPVVFYGNLGYTWNIAEDVDTTINTSAGSAKVGRVDPGDSIGMSFGMGLGLNQAASFNLGYDHNYIMKTEQEIGSSTRKGDTLHIGSFLFGISHSLNDTVGLNATLQIGVTEEAPDMQFTLRFPWTIELW